MGNSICIQKTKPSKLKRLAFLPRMAVTVDIAGRQFTYRQAPLAETLLNLWGTRPSVERLIRISHQQLSEITLPKLPKF